MSITTVLPVGHSQAARSSDLLRSSHVELPLRWQNIAFPHLTSSIMSMPGPSSFSALSAYGLLSAVSLPLNLLWDFPSQNGALSDFPHLHRAYVSDCGSSRPSSQTYMPSLFTILFS